MARPVPPQAAVAAREEGTDVDDVAPRRRPRRPLVWALVAVLVLVAAGLGWWRFHDPGPAPLTRGDVAKAVAEGLAKAQEEQRRAAPDAALVYRTITPSLVTITTDGAAPAAGDGKAASDGTKGLGTGTVVNADGSVLTAWHVVGRAKKIEVRFADGTVATGLVSRADEKQDIAVLAVDKLPEVVVPAVLGGGVGVGDAVYPVGNPLGLERSLTAGVVSAVDRKATTDAGLTLEGLIQFDAAVNPGSSGGPLLDRNGQVVGVVTGLASPDDRKAFVGIGFAVPIQTAGGAAGGPQI